MEASIRATSKVEYNLQMNEATIIAVQRGMSFARAHMGIASNDPIHSITDFFTKIAQEIRPPTLLGEVKPAGSQGHLPIPVPTPPTKIHPVSDAVLSEPLPVEEEDHSGDEDDADEE